MKNRLSIHYCLHQLIYFGASAGIISFATTFLLGKGFPASQVGLLLACSGLLSCISQPTLASFADRAKKNVLPGMAAGLAAGSMACFGSLLLFRLPVWLFGILYLLGVWCFDTMIPLMNSISVYYHARGYPINYGLARGLGSLAFSFAALGLGYIIDAFGLDWMIIYVLIMLALFILLTFGYPQVEHSITTPGEKKAECCPLGVFVLRYRWYCLSLFGILLLACFHSMTENYLIAIVGRLGGSSSHVGTALFIATLSSAPVLSLISLVRKRLPDHTIMMIAAFSFLLKAVLFLAAPSIPFIYLAQLLQMTSYAFLSPVQVYYANAKISSADMVKGQAFISASYTLGCGAGNMLGGVLVERFGVLVLLAAGVVISAAGTLVLGLTVRKTDKFRREQPA